MGGPSTSGGAGKGGGGGSTSGGAGKKSKLQQATPLWHVGEWWRLKNKACGTVCSGVCGEGDKVIDFGAKA